MPAGFARRARIQPRRFRSPANPVSDFASRLGEALVLAPLDIRSTIRKETVFTPPL